MRFRAFGIEAKLNHKEKTGGFMNNTREFKIFRRKYPTRKHYDVLETIALSRRLFVPGNMRRQKIPTKSRVPYFLR